MRTLRLLAGLAALALLTGACAAGGSAPGSGVTSPVGQPGGSQTIDRFSGYGTRAGL
jgi:hypothetical protein